MLPSFVATSSTREASAFFVLRLFFFLFHNVKGGTTSYCESRNFSILVLSYTKPTLLHILSIACFSLAFTKCRGKLHFDLPRSLHVNFRVPFFIHLHCFPCSAFLLGLSLFLPLHSSFMPSSLSFYAEFGV